jgi:hypothetical protein
MCQFLDHSISRERIMDFEWNLDSDLTTMRPTYGQNLKWKLHRMVIYRIAWLWLERQVMGTYSFQLSLFSLSPANESDPCRSVQTLPLSEISSLSNYGLILFLKFIGAKLDLLVLSSIDTVLPIISFDGYFYCSLAFFWKVKQTYRTRIKPDRGEISFRNELPIWAAANGIRPWLNSNNRLKLTNMPWAVSGRR